MTKLPTFRPASPLHSRLDLTADFNKPPLRGQSLRQRTTETACSYGDSGPSIGSTAGQASVATQSTLSSLLLQGRVPGSAQPAGEEALSALAVDCGEVTGKWIKEPWPDITDAKLHGPFTDGVQLEYHLELTFKFVGELECLDCGRPRSRTTFEAGPYTEVFAYRTYVFMLLLPFRLKIILYAFKAARLLEFVRENEEIIKLILAHYDKLIWAIKNSADIICKGAFDPEQLKQYIPAPPCPPGLVCA